MHRARNAAASALRYAMDPMEQYKLQNAIEEAGLDLGVIYHSHTRSDPIPSETDINLAKLGDTDAPAFPGTLYLIVGVKGPRGRPAPVVDRRQPGRAGRLPGDGMTGALVCPSCASRARGRTSASATTAGCRWCTPASARGAAALRARDPRPQGPPALRRGPARARRLGAQPGRGRARSRACCSRRASRRSRAAPAASTCRTSSPPARATSSSPPPAWTPRASSSATAAPGAAERPARARALDARPGVARAGVVVRRDRGPLAVPVVGSAAGDRLGAAMPRRLQPFSAAARGRGVSATRPRCGGSSAGTRSPARGSARRGAGRGRA